MDRSFAPVYWLNIADRSIPFVAVIEHTNFIPPGEYGGRHIVYVSNYLKADSPLFSMSEEDLLAEYAPHLRKVNPSFDTSWVRESHLFREGGAQPVITLHYSQRIPEHRTPMKGLYLANTTQIYPEDRGVNYSVRLGKEAAEIVAQDAV
jgi:protoporphyrinogen oxidase